VLWSFGPTGPEKAGRNRARIRSSLCGRAAAGKLKVLGSPNGLELLRLRRTNPPCKGFEFLQGHDIKGDLPACLDVTNVQAAEGSP